MIPVRFAGSARPIRGVVALVLAFALSLLSCRDLTGPGSRAERFARGMSFLAQFPGPLASVTAGAGSVIAFNRVVVEFRRSTAANGTEVALRRVIDFGAEMDSVQLSLNVPLSPDAPPSGEMLALHLFYLNAADDTVFTGGPVAVLAVPSERGGEAPAPVPVPLVYSGPGADATGVSILPETLTVAVNAPFAFTGSATDAQANVIAGAPIIFSSLDTALALVTSPGAGSGVARGTAGVARIMAQLVTSDAADTATLVITPVDGGPTRTIALVTGGAQTGYTGELLAAPITVRVTDAQQQPVVGEVVAFAVSGGGGSVTGAAPLTDANGDATLGGWTLGGTPGANALTVTVQDANPLVITATGVEPPPAIVLSVVGSNVIGVERSGALSVRLLQPAPAGGIVVTVVSDSTAYLEVQAPNTASIPAGESEGAVLVNGLALGNAVVRATAPGYEPDTLTVPVSLNLISLPPTLNVPFTQTTSLPITLSAPAPAAGLKVAVASEDPSVVRVLADTVVIPAGALVGSVQVEGVALGDALVIATNPNFAFDDALVSVTASVNIVAATVALNGSFGGSMVVRLESGGSPVAAPAGGVALALSAGDATCATVAPTATIGAGLTSVTVPVAYGGSAALPCATQVHAVGPTGFGEDSATANVAVVPPINLTPTIALGAGLQRFASGSLGSNAHGGTTVRLTSLDSSVVRLAPDATTAGTGFIDVPMGLLATSIQFYVQGMEGITADTTSIVASAPGFVDDTIAVYIWQAVYQLGGLSTTGTTYTANNAFYVRVGTPNGPAGTSVSSFDDVRAGGALLTVQVVNDSLAVGDLVTTALTADSLDLSIAPGAGFTPTSVATGGVAFDYLTEGTAVLRANIAGLRPLAGATQAVTVSAPQLALPIFRIGSGLQRASTVSLSAPAPAGVGQPVRIFADRVGSALFSAADDQVGVDTLDLTIPPGSTFAQFYVQALEGRLADTLTYTATGANVTSSTRDLYVFQAVYEINGLSAAGTVGDGDDAFWVVIGSPSSPTAAFMSTSDAIRAGGTTLTAQFVNDGTVVGDLVTSTVTTDSLDLTIPAGARFTPTSVATGGVALHYAAAGAALVRSTINGLRRLPGGTQTVNVSAPALTLNTMNLGSGLQRATSVSLSSPAPAGGTSVTLSASEAGVLLFAPNATTIGSATLVLPIAAGATFASFVVQTATGIIADTVTITATAAGVTTGTADVRVWQAVHAIGGLVTSRTSLDPTDAFYVQIGTPSSPAGTFVNTADAVSAAAAPLTVTLTSSAATIGQLVTTAVTDDIVTVVIPLGANLSPTTVAAGGVAFDPLTTGTTTIAASIPGLRALAGSVGTDVVVSAPAITVNARTVGSGLSASTNASLGAAEHGGVTVTVASSNPSIALVAPDVNTLATPSFSVFVPNGSTLIAFVVVGVEGATGAPTVNVTADGFLTGAATLTIVQPAIAIASLSTTGTVGAAANPFYVQVGLPNLSQTGLNEVQNVRFGSPGLSVNIGTSNPAVGPLLLGTSPTRLSTLSLTIAAGVYYTPTTPASGGASLEFLAPGTTRVQATAPGLISTTAATVDLTVTP